MLALAGQCMLHVACRLDPVLQALLGALVQSSLKTSYVKFKFDTPGLGCFTKSQNHGASDLDANSKEKCFETV